MGRWLIVLGCFAFATSAWSMDSEDIKVAMGEAAEFITTGQRAVPHRAEELGYEFRWPSLDPALASILKK